MRALNFEEEFAQLGSLRFTAFAKVREIHVATYELLRISNAPRKYLRRKILICLMFIRNVVSNATIVSTGDKRQVHGVSPRNRFYSYRQPRRQNSFDMESVTSFSQTLDRARTSTKMSPTSFESTKRHGWLLRRDYSTVRQRARFVDPIHSWNHTVRGGIMRATTRIIISFSFSLLPSRLARFSVQCTAIKIRWVDRRRFSDSCGFVLGRTNSWCESLRVGTCTSVFDSLCTFMADGDLIVVKCTALDSRCLRWLAK